MNRVLAKSRDNFAQMEREAAVDEVATILRSAASREAEQLFTAKVTQSSTNNTDENDHVSSL